jgi:hypothetical protein
MMTYKGSRHRTDGKDFKKYQSNQTLWDNLDKKRLEAAGIKILEIKKK